MTIETFCKEICKGDFIEKESMLNALTEYEQKIKADAIEECARTIEISKTLFENHQTATIMLTKDKCIAMIRNLKGQK